MDLTELKRYAMYIDGTWESSDRMFESINPYTEQPWALIPEADEPQIDRAVAAARRAFDSGPWPTMTGSQRAKLLVQLAEALEQHSDAIGRIETMDNGKPIRETANQGRFAARNYRYFAGVADKLHGEVIPLDNGSLFDFTIREAVGVCVLIIAWNSPMQTLANKLAPALAAGNVVVIKPSEHASASILELAKLVEEVGFPKGVVNVVTGAGKVGAALTSHPDVDLVSMTGGVSTGQAVVRGTSENLAKAVLELGGKSPHIVFEDADLDRAVPGVMAGIFAAAGQSCVAGSRLILHESIHERFMEALVARVNQIKLGNPLDPATEMGPLANENQYRKVLEYIRIGQEEDGAGVACGGRRPEGPEFERGYFVKPTIFVNATNQMRIAREEIFGPVLTVIPFRNEEEAIQIANDTSYGLASGFWTQRLDRTLRIARRLRAGTVWVNTYRNVSAAAPFGGYKRSGIGRERGLEGLLEFTQIKNVMIDTTEGSERDPFSIRT